MNGHFRYLEVLLSLLSFWVILDSNFGWLKSDNNLIFLDMVAFILLTVVMGLPWSPLLCIQTASHLWHCSHGWALCQSSEPNLRQEDLGLNPTPLPHGCMALGIPLLSQICSFISSMEKMLSTSQGVLQGLARVTAPALSCPSRPTGGAVVGLISQITENDMGHEQWGARSPCLTI